jgi:hypothetical protein
MSIHEKMFIYRGKKELAPGAIFFIVLAIFFCCGCVCLSPLVSKQRARYIYIYIYMYIYMYICMYMYIYICMYIYT